MQVNEANTRLICANIRAETSPRSSRAEYIELMQERIYELEKINAKLDLENSEIRAMAVTPDFMRVEILRRWDQEQLERFCLHLLGDKWQTLGSDAAELSALVLEYLPAGRLRPTTPPQIVARMLEMARKIAPEKSLNCTVCGGVFSVNDMYSVDACSEKCQNAIQTPRTDPVSYTLENSPAQTGEAGAARFVPD